MLKLTVVSGESYDESTSQFVSGSSVDLELEHSLVSLSKWESKHEKAFLNGKPKTSEETLDYIKAMILTPDFPPDIVERMSNENLDQISAYIDSKATATTFSDRANGRGSSELITSELVYYWMIALTIPFECQYWHFNRLLTLIKICNIKNQKPQKMGAREAAQQQRSLNAQRRAASGSRG